MSLRTPLQASSLNVFAALTIGAAAVVIVGGVNAQSEQVTLRVAGFGAAGSVAAIKMINAQFMQKNPGVKVEFEEVAGLQYQSILNTRFVAGDAPDVVMSNGVDFAKPWLKAGYLSDLTDQSWVKNVIKGNRNETYLGTKKAYQFVIENAGVGLFYNKQILDDAGIAVPQNYPQFIAAMTKLKADGKTPISIGAKIGWGALMPVATGIVSTAYRTNPDYDERLLNGQAKFDSPEWRTVLQRVVDWSKAGFFDPKMSLGIGDFEQAAGEFIAGRAAFLVHGSWNVDALRDSKTNKFAYGFMPFPGNPVGTKSRAIIFANANFVVNAKSKQPEASRKYLNFWADNIDTYLKETGGRYSSLTTSKYREVETAEFGRALSENRASVYPVGNWDRPSFQEFFMKQMQQLLTDNNVDSVVKALDIEFNRK